MSQDEYRAVDRTNITGRIFGMAGLMKTFQIAKVKEQMSWAKERSDGFVRFAFCKQQALIEQSLDRLEGYFAKQ